MIKVLFDTNVIIDAFTERTQNYLISQNLVVKAIDKEIEGFLISKQVTDIYYILRKFKTEAERRHVLKVISKTFTILPTLASDVAYSINSKMADYEDALIDEIAKVNMLSYIITNNLKDFEKSKTMALSPENFYELLNINK